MIVYGPVPSRRLGQSIGVNNIPPKVCSYSCIYCQLGRTDKMQAKRREFYHPEAIFAEAEQKIKQLAAENKKADYISFVPDGEPTLDVNLGKEIELLKKLDTKIAVITNSSMLWLDDVKEDLLKADWVSVKIDAADETAWHNIDRPHGSLKLPDILAGIQDFAKVFKGKLVTETMLVDSVNDSRRNLEKIAEQVALIQPDMAYLLVPTRPPAEQGVKRAESHILKEAADFIKSRAAVRVECITGDEQEEGFFVTENAIQDILSITSVHPIREDIIDDLLKKHNLSKAVIAGLVKEGKLVEFVYEGRNFFRRNLNSK